MSHVTIYLCNTPVEAAESRFTSGHKINIIHKHDHVGHHTYSQLFSVLHLCYTPFGMSQVTVLGPAPLLFSNKLLRRSSEAEDRKQRANNAPCFRDLSE